MFSKKRILVTGAYGFIGSYLLKRLILHKDFDCWGVSSGKNFSPARFNAKEHLLVFDQDLEELLGPIKDAPRFDIIVHTASYGNYHWQIQPQNIFRMLDQLLLLLLYCQATGCKLIHLGSSVEFGELIGEGLETNHIPNHFNSLYALVKFFQEQLIKYFGKQLQVSCVNLRLYSIFGPGEHPLRLIPTICRGILLNNPIPWINYNTERDFVYIEDLYQLIESIIINFPDSCSGESFNVASGKSIPLEQLKNNLLSHYPNLVIQNDPQINRSWDVSLWRGNPDRTHKILGWRVQTDFWKGLNQTIEFYSNNIHLLDVHSFSPWPKISFVITCFNDAASIKLIINEIIANYFQYKIRPEIIIIDDNDSQDSFNQLIDTAKQSTLVTIIRNQVNLGSQLCILRGILRAKGDAVIVMDGDLQDPVSVCWEMIQLFHKGYDIVLPSRKKREEAMLLQWARRLFYRIWKVLIQKPNNVYLDVGDFCLVRTHLLAHLKKYPPSFFSWRTYRNQIPGCSIIIYYKRPQSPLRSSTNSLLRLLFWSLRFWLSSPNFIPLIFIVVVLIAQLIWNDSQLILILIWGTLLLLIFMIEKIQINHTNLLNSPYHIFSKEKDLS
ncbi:MAG: NAD-dependent epimerase/dehydratase family protein [Bdellovibrionaceae bacterium]|nr:NAD-dependent epimerase/dehydratase family protein [Pseudobdellovibrionaceae bacterium]MDW8189922.1 NAD-dependent epimerase/dehydratase family protein [Pseudobdellovibrionaceae bacterium]